MGEKKSDVIWKFSKTRKSYLNNSYSDVLYFGDIWERNQVSGKQHIVAHDVSENNATLIISALESSSTISEENKRLREALEFYADEAMYEKKLVSKSLCPQIEPDEYTPAYIPRFDKGYRARKALGGEGIDIPNEG